MSTTADIDQDLLEKLRRKAEGAGLSFREVLNQVIRRGLIAEAATREPYVLPILDLGIDPSIDIDKIRHYLDDLEDEERLRKMNLGR